MMNILHKIIYVFGISFIAICPCAYISFSKSEDKISISHSTIIDKFEKLLSVKSSENIRIEIDKIREGSGLIGSSADFKLICPSVPDVEKAKFSANFMKKYNCILQFKKMQQIYPIYAALSASKRMIHLAKTIEKKQRIEANDIIYQWAPLKNGFTRMVTSKKDVAGKYIARRRLYPHEPLKWSDLVKAAEIKRGGIVYINLINKNLRIKVKAKALMDAYKNESAKFQILNSKKMVTARVLNKDQVEVLW